MYLTFLDKEIILSRYRAFDVSKIKLFPLSARENDLSVSGIKNIERTEITLEGISEVAAAMSRAKVCGAARVMMMGAHVLRDGVQRYIIDMMERGIISCIAMNGAGIIHDYEFSLIGATTESVAKYIKDGQFGMWSETSRINDLVKDGARNDCGIGETVGQKIYESDLPHKDISVSAAAWRLGIPLTVHVGIGYDILCEHPNYDGASWGSASYRDFLIFAEVLKNLENGVVMNFGSAVMAPEVFLKALSMARNVSHRAEKNISRFTALVCDLHDIPFGTAEAPKTSAAYYYRPWKTMLVRTVADGGKSYYIKGRHSETIPQLWSKLTEVNE